MNKTTLNGGHSMIYQHKHRDEVEGFLVKAKDISGL